MDDAVDLTTRSSMGSAWLLPECVLCLALCILVCRWCLFLSRDIILHPSLIMFMARYPTEPYKPAAAIAIATTLLAHIESPGRCHSRVPRALSACLAVATLIFVASFGTVTLVL